MSQERKINRRSFLAGALASVAVCSIHSGMINLGKAHVSLERELSSIRLLMHEINNNLLKGDLNAELAHYIEKDVTLIEHLKGSTWSKTQLVGGELWDTYALRSGENRSFNPSNFLDIYFTRAHSIPYLKDNEQRSISLDLNVNLDGSLITSSEAAKQRLSEEQARQLVSKCLVDSENLLRIQSKYDGAFNFGNKERSQQLPIRHAFVTEDGRLSVHLTSVHKTPRYIP